MALRGAFDDLALPVTAFLAELQVNSTAQASGAIAANLLVGAKYNILSTSVSTALTTPTAAAMYAQLVSVLTTAGLPNPLQNLANPVFNENGGSISFEIRISTSGAGLTISAGTGVTISGTATIATGAYRDFLVNMTSPTTAVVTNLGGGTL